MTEDVAGEATTFNPADFKHPPELLNRINLDRAIAAEARVAELEAWKREAILVLDQWELVFESACLIEATKIGEGKSAVVLRVVERAAALEALLLEAQNETVFLDPPRQWEWRDRVAAALGWKPRGEKPS